MTRMIVVRHGQTPWNRVERLRGRSDVGLDAMGLRQAEATADCLVGCGAVAVYSSPLRRALVTADKIAGRLGLVSQSLDGLIDIDYGEWQGLSPAEALERDRALYDCWMERPQEAVFPRGESLQQVRGRVVSVLKSMSREHDGESVVLVSHVVVCRVLICAILGLDISHFWQVGQDVCAINTIGTRAGRLVLDSLNDTCHLKRLT